MRMTRPAATGHIERALNHSRLREPGALGIPFEAGELLAVDDLRPIEGFEVRHAAHRLVADQFVADHDFHIGSSEEHTSELQSLMRISYAVLCLTKNIHKQTTRPT